MSVAPYSLECDPDKAYLLEFTFRIDAVDDYVNSRITLIYKDDVTTDRKQADIDFVPDALVENVIRIVDYLESWKGMFVFTLRLFNIDKKAGTFDSTITARLNKYSRIGRFYTPSTEYPDEIREALLVWHASMEAAYATQPIGVGIPHDDIRPM